MTSNQATQPTMVSSGGQPQGVSSGRILLAEDNYGCQMLAIWTLTRAGYEVVVAENGQQVVEKVQQTSYDLILIDMQMPVMDGATVTTTIRNLGYRSVPIIGLTEYEGSFPKHMRPFRRKDKTTCRISITLEELKDLISSLNYYADLSGNKSIAKRLRQLAMELEPCTANFE